MAAAGLAVPEGFNLDLLVDQLQIRTKFWSDIPGNCAYFFTDDYPFDEKAVEKLLKDILQKECQDYGELMKEITASGSVSRCY